MKLQVVRRKSSAKKNLIILGMLFLLVGAFVVYLTWFARIGDTEMSRRVAAAEKKDDCKAGLKQFENTKLSRLSNEGGKTLLHYKVTCQYKLEQHQAALDSARQLEKIYESQNDTGRDKLLLDGTIRSLQVDIENDKVNKQNAERLKKEGTKKTGEEYNGPIL